MSNVFTYSMPYGIPGAVNRVGGRGPDIEAQIMDPTHPLPFYGLFGQIDATTGFFRQLTSTDAAVYGLLVRPYPEQPTTATGFSGSISLGTAAVPPQFQTAIDVLKSGYMTVKLYNTTAAVKNGAVYTRIADNDATGFPLGDVEAAADSSGGTNTLLVTPAYFMGPADSNGNVEIAYNI